jgi:5-methylcytosine-specific restriction protein B
MATALLEHKDDRSRLIAHIHDMGAKFDGMQVLKDKSSSGEQFPLKDICPYTTFGIFNRRITNENRITIAREFAKFLGLEEEVPTTFEGIPILNPQKSWFFSNEAIRKPRDIDDLWQFFATSIALADGDDDEDLKAAFIRDYDQAQACRGVSWNLTMGLYWTRPWDYAPLDTRSRSYLEEHMGETVAIDGPNRQCMGESYLRLIERLRDSFSADECPVHSFPDLSLAAWSTSKGGGNDEDGGDDDPNGKHDKKTTPPATSYAIEDIVADGCFVPQDRLNSLSLNSDTQAVCLSVENLVPGNG